MAAELSFEQIKAKMLATQAGRAALMPPVIPSEHEMANKLLHIATEQLNTKSMELDAEKEKLRRVAEYEASRGKAHVVKKTLASLLEKYAVEPAEELIKLAMGRDENGEYTCSIQQQIDIWEGLMSYQMPKLKAVEHSGQVDHSIQVTIKQFGGPAMKITQVEKPVMDAVEIPGEESNG